ATRPLCRRTPAARARLRHLPHANIRPYLFLSYSRKDLRRAKSLESALKSRRNGVWRDITSIEGGKRWSQAIEEGIRASRGTVVLLTPASSASAWVTYEYAFATGAGVPVVGVAVRGTTIPRPIQQYHIIRYEKLSQISKAVSEGLRAQSNLLAQKTSTPNLLA